VALNIIFCLSVAGSVAGLQQLVQLKSAPRSARCPLRVYIASLTRLPRAAAVRSWDIFKTVSLLSGIISVLIVLSAVWILIEVGQARRNVKALREENARADDDFNSSDKYFNSSDNSSGEGPGQDRLLKNSKAFKDFTNLVTRAKKEDQQAAQKNKKSRGLSRRSGGNTVSPTETGQ